MVEAEVIINEIIERWLVYAKDYLGILKEFKKSHSAQNHIKQIQLIAYLDEAGYTVKKYATKEQKLRIKNELGRDFRKFF